MHTQRRLFVLLPHLLPETTVPPNYFRQNETYGEEADKAEIDRRFIPSSNCCRRRKQTLHPAILHGGMGVQKRQAETYLQRAREIIRADYSVERSDFLGTRLAC